MGLFGSDKRSRNAAAVITGAGSGIGAAFAVELAKRGGRVVCSDIDENAAQATADVIGIDGGKALALRCDVAQIDDVHCLAADAQDWFGGAPSVVINNAGVGAGGLPIGEVSIDDWNWVLNVNLWGPIHGCHVFAPILRDAGVWRHHQRRLGRRLRCGARHGGLQRQQGRRAVAVGNPCGRTERHRSERHGAVPDIRQDQHRRIRSDIGQVDTDGEQADALDRLLRQNGWHVRAWTPSTAAASTACRNPTPGSAGASSVSLRRCTPAPSASLRV